MTLEDEDLLRKAAGAAGLLFGTTTDGAAYVWHESGKYTRYWDPLSNSTDAFDLMCLLGISISRRFCLGVEYATASVGVCNDKSVALEADAGAATRRAITMAAASLPHAIAH